MSEQVVTAFDGSRSGPVEQITLYFVGTKAYSRLEWWKIEDPGGWPPFWHSPHPPSLSRPPARQWRDPDFRLRPHP